MRRALLATAILLSAALPAGANERTEVLTNDRVHGTITDDARFHEYLVTVPRGGLLRVSLPLVKGSSLHGSMGMLSRDYKDVRIVGISKRTIQMLRTVGTESVTRVLVTGTNDTVGDYELRPKIKLAKRAKLKASVKDLSPPGSLTFGALAGQVAQLKVTWAGPDAVTVDTFLAPDGSDVTSDLEAKTKKRSWRQRGFAITQTGDYRVTLAIPPSAKKWTVSVKLSGQPTTNGDVDLRPVHTLPPELLLQSSPTPYPVITVLGEEGAGNTVIALAANKSPIVVAFPTATVQTCNLFATEPGSSPSTFGLNCEDLITAQFEVTARDASGRITGLTVDPLNTPAGDGSTIFTDLVQAANNRPLSWTEVRTFETSGNEHTLVVSDIEQFGSRAYTYSVTHTNAAGQTRRYDFLPFQ